MIKGVQRLNKKPLKAEDKYVTKDNLSFYGFGQVLMVV